MFEVIRANTHRCTIVLVDPDDVFRTRAGRLLRNVSNAVEVVHCRTGEEAVRCVRERAPALVISELALPKMNGWELAALLRNEAPETPMVIVSTDGSAQDWAALSQMGVRNFVLKPIQEKSFGPSMLRCARCGSRSPADLRLPDDLAG